MAVPKRRALLVLLKLEQARADQIRLILRLSAQQVKRDLELAPSGTMSATQLRAQQASIKAMLAQDWTNIERAVREGQKDAAVAASRVLSEYEDELLKLVATPAQMESLAASEALRASRGLEAALRRMEGSSYLPLSSQVYKTKSIADGWIDRTINQALVSGWDAKRLAREIAGSIDPNVRGGVSYAANRLARTEINNAFHASAIKRYQDSGLVDGVDWNLSTSHPEGDICDTLAAESPYDTRKVPRKPHPHCYCYLTPHLPSEEDFMANLLNGKYDGEAWNPGYERNLGGDRLA